MKVSLLVIMAGVFAIQPTTAKEIYRGACDASAAVSIGNNHFLVAADEYNRPDKYNPGDSVDRGDFLLLYKKGQSKPKRVIALPQSLRDNPERELDIEGAARIGDRVFWITSHGRNKKGKERPNRYRFFAVDLQGDPVDGDFSIGFVAGIDNLLQQMLNSANWANPTSKLTQQVLNAIYRSSRLGEDLRKKKRKLLAPKKSGLNIEGLAPGRDGNNLLIALRNPLVAGKAIILTLKNANRLLTGKDRTAKFAEPALLDLDYRGIRSIVFSAKQDSYFLIAGPTGSKGDFALFQWSGSGSASKIKNIPTSKNSNPEAIVLFPDTQKLMIVNDEGKQRRKGHHCNAANLEDQSFSSLDYNQGKGFE